MTCAMADVRPMAKKADARGSPLVTVGLSFQFGPTGQIQQRKGALVFKASASLQNVLEAISGHDGERSLWPRQFADSRGHPMVACFFSCDFNDGEWLPRPSGSQLSKLAGHAGRVQLLLQLCHRADAAAMGALPYFDISWALIVAVAAEGDHGGGGAALLEHPAPSCRPLWGATAELTRLLSE
ncbi:unnamed protein product, partial [Prorocentrum cordatum]